MKGYLASNYTELCPAFRGFAKAHTKNELERRWGVLPHSSRRSGATPNAKTAPPPGEPEGEADGLWCGLLQQRRVPLDGFGGAEVPNYVPDVERRKFVRLPRGLDYDDRLGAVDRPDAAARFAIDIIYLTNPEH